MWFVDGLVKVNQSVVFRLFLPALCSEVSSAMPLHSSRKSRLSASDTRVDFLWLLTFRRLATVGGESNRWCEGPFSLISFFFIYYFHVHLKLGRLLNKARVTVLMHRRGRASDQE